MCPVSDIARASGRKPEEVERDLLDMVRRGYFPLGFVDAETACFYADNAAWRAQNPERARQQDAPLGLSLIHIYYDVDGVTATALLYTYLDSAGADVYYKLPSRDDDGYGLSETAVDLMAAKGVSLIVTVDNGCLSLIHICSGRAPAAPH